jgi:glycosyltransferase involved in cell wall biosynthesis
MIKDSVNNMPLVSVIVLCYNQSKYVIESIQSILNQTYDHLEIIVVDDASTDNSSNVIRSFLADKPDIQFLSFQENVGNTRAFNQAFALAQGAYIIDLAADDLLMPERIAIGVRDFQKAGPHVGVHYTNAYHIDEAGQILKQEYEKDPPPEGDLYQKLITNYFINPASMMLRTEMLSSLSGYDDSLSYEDFDLWIRSSRYYHYQYNPYLGVKKRKVTGSLSSGQFRWFSRHQRTTFKVCEKIYRLNRNKAEDQALKSRILYEIKWTLRYGNLLLSFRYLRLFWKVLFRPDFN